MAKTIPQRSNWCDDGQAFRRDDAYRALRGHVLEEGGSPAASDDGRRVARR